MRTSQLGAGKDVGLGEAVSPPVGQLVTVNGGE